MGLSGKHGRRLETYAELKVDNADATEAMVGFKTKFAGGEVKGNISSSGKVQSVYRKFIELFEMEMSSNMDLKNPQKPVQFGVALSMRQM